MNVIELFAGAAGLAQGFEYSGYYETLALYDLFEPAQSSYLAYRPQSRYRIADIRYLKTKTVQKDIDGRELHGILGGPPCQGFSLAGKKLTDAEINQLVLAYARKVEQLEPRFLVMENVPQLLYHPLFRPLLKKLGKRYAVAYGILNAARYGAPQTRHRLILIAYHKDYGIHPTLPSPTHGRRGQCLYAYHLPDSDARIPFCEETAEAILGADPVISREISQQSSLVSNAILDSMEPLVTVGDAISDVANIAVEGDLIGYAHDPLTEYQRRLRNDATVVANCVSRKHVGRPREIALTLREGGTPESDNGPRNKRYYSQAYGRLHRDGLARTLTTYFQNAGSGRFLHYEQPRTLSIREAARLQGFPDKFVFYGTLADQMQLVGNAVPLPLAEALANHIAAELGPLISA